MLENEGEKKGENPCNLAHASSTASYTHAYIQHTFLGGGESDNDLLRSGRKQQTAPPYVFEQ